MKFLKNNSNTYSFQPLINNTHTFDFQRSLLLNTTTVTEHHRASRIVNAMDIQEQNTTDDPLIRFHLKKKTCQRNPCRIKV
jgi:hypothetical protein